MRRATIAEVLACSHCNGRLSLHTDEGNAEEVESGSLACETCSKSWPVVRGIPRFVSEGSYADSFGWQWNEFRKAQLDGFGFRGPMSSGARFFSETGWSADWLKGKLLLDAGCGAGRFAEIAAHAGARVIAVDITSAVDACAVNMRELGLHGNAEPVQASLYELPFRPGTFDGVYCLGVIQHTPDPQRTIQLLPRYLRPGGRIAYNIYERNWQCWLKYRYYLRPITRRLPQDRAMRVARALVALTFPVGRRLCRLPKLGRWMVKMLPAALYCSPDMELEHCRTVSLLDTFDQLSPTYDQPQRAGDVLRWLKEVGVVGLERRGARGVTVTGARPCGAARRSGRTGDRPPQSW